MTHDANADDTLLQLRRDMLDFVIQELASRSLTQSSPGLAEGVSEALRAEISAAVTASMNETRRAEASEVAALVVQFLQDPESARNEAESEPEKERKGRRRGRAEERSWPGVLRDTWKRMSWPTFLLAGGVLALVIVVGLLFVETRQLKHDQDQADTARGAASFALVATCERNGRIRDELRAMVDSPQYRGTCGRERADRRNNPVCVAFDRVGQLSTQPHCPTAPAR
jgi:hypothetical protein